MPPYGASLVWARSCRGTSPLRLNGLGHIEHVEKWVPVPLLQPRKLASRCCARLRVSRLCTDRFMTRCKRRTRSILCSFFVLSVRPGVCHHRPIWHLPTSAAVGEQRHPAQQPGGRDGPVLYARVPSMVSNGAVRLLKPTQVTPVACSFQLDTPVRGWRGEGQSQETGMFTIAYE